MSGTPVQPVAYPASRAERDRWILQQRAGVARRSLDPRRPSEFLLESERSDAGEMVPVATIFLTNRECPWRCLMCDLWRATLTETVPAGAIPEQIDFALARLPAARHVKLYNSGSFFDPRAIPLTDYAPIAERVRGFERVIVESHPRLIGQNCWRFQELIAGQLEVAMGLETVHPEIGPRLNKGVTPGQFAEAADKLRKRGVALRVFILVKPPFLLDEAEALHWATRSVEFAFACGASAAVLIPTRAGNGAMEQLAERGEFVPPSLRLIEAAAAHGVGLQRGRVFVDEWNLEQFSVCSHCFPERAVRLQTMNCTQRIPPVVSCGVCSTSTATPLF